jgi:hypothetical protein
VLLEREGLSEFGRAGHLTEPAIDVPRGPQLKAKPVGATRNLGDEAVLIGSYVNGPPRDIAGALHKYSHGVAMSSIDDPDAT